ncbi:AAA family ATPase [Paenalcaligenes hominis]|uniref:AAA family ATPase n=1 Tax=Paenalcaligenes hominis TaxID=643674 RepID=UPI0035235197
MRLLSLRLKNLNSLEGEWFLDFTCPDYEAHGLFAITGPTGSGKSTLLDAISLALFGRTPRLDRISASQNDIMSRHTGECFAEVCFETDDGQFRVHWAQHRARKNPQGELQAPRHELAKMECGTVLEHQLRRVASEIERITGMDFDRFTRSMLLAQGNFAAFLQADADQRAPILEQITGTAIYSDLSILAYERYSVEKKTLQDLMQALDHIELLSSEQEQHMQHELEELRATLLTLGDELAQYRATLHALEKREQCQQKQLHLAHELSRLQQKKQAFAASAHRLQEALKAALLEKEHSVLMTQRAELCQAKTKAQDLTQRLAQLQQQLQQQQELVERAEIKTLHSEKDLQKQRPVFQEVRALDAAIQRLDSQLNDLAEQKQTLALTQQKEWQCLEDCQKQVQQTQSNHDAHKHYLDENQVDSQLSAQLGTIMQCADYVHVLQKDLDKKKESLGLFEARQKQLEAQHQNILSTKTQHENQLQLALANLKQKERDWQELIQSRSVTQWHEQLDVRKSEYDKALALMDFAQDSKAWQQHYQQRLQRIHHLKELEQSTQQALHHELSLLSAQEQTTQTLERLLVSEQRISTMEHERAQLEQDQPCPLCGSVEHPWAEQAITPQIAQTQQELSQSKQQLQVLQQQVQAKRDKLHRTQGQLQSEQNQIEQEQQWQTQRIEQFSMRQGLENVELLQRLAQPEKLQHEVQLAKEALQKTQGQLTQITAAENALLSVKEEAAQHQQSVATLVLKMDQCSEQLKEQAERVAECGRDVKQLNERLEQEQTALLTSCKPYGLTTTQLPDEFIAQLQVRQQHWQQQQQAWQQSREQLQQLALTQVDQQARYTQAHTQFKQIEKTLAQLTQERQSLHQNRHGLLGNEIADLVESQLEQQLKADQVMQQQAQAKWQEINSHKTHTYEALAEQKRHIDALNTILSSNEKRFVEQLERIGFDSEAAYQQAVLPLEERDNLTTQQQRLRTDEQLLQTQHQDTVEQLQGLNTELGTQTTEQVRAHEQAVRHTYDAKQQYLGQLTAQLKRNQQQKQKTAAQQALVEQQKVELEKWSQLRELIGSADGKKFRNFAQGLTFDRMIHQANQQLERMQDRYLLVRHPTEALVLNVVDNYQAGEVRSTKNLSGGESFLISLALALGLSQMASQNVRLDSLFLDEGFGTLDEEALDIALDTLGSLYQEGKIIGVISHVPALKERIATQIQVQPLQGGRSRLEGPGCERIA